MPESDEMGFLLSISYERDRIPYGLLREAIRAAVNSVEGLSFESIHQMSDPDPYDFSDPDNLPEGIR